MDVSKIGMWYSTEIKYRYLSCVMETNELGSDTNKNYSYDLMNALLCT